MNHTNTSGSIEISKLQALSDLHVLVISRASLRLVQAAHEEDKSKLTNAVLEDACRHGASPSVLRFLVKKKGLDEEGICMLMAKTFLAAIPLLNMLDSMIMMLPKKATFHLRGNEYLPWASLFHGTMKASMGDPAVKALGSVMEKVESIIISRSELKEEGIKKVLAMLCRSGNKTENVHLK
ncbi:expressed unknown protein [Seminavis robusta]|uniref:Uncharacterized protein n=1 Tax=Seminavis robusta TaxID=568900 RepID=A0A9N8H8A2_9STRA|nr:expressed unknown protein [Seminavis robusta]|eukprot:Sro154_g070040.1 n/a (181) ;mRNA; f:46449-47131